MIKTGSTITKLYQNGTTIQIELDSTDKAGFDTTIGGVIIQLPSKEIELIKEIESSINRIVKKYAKKQFQTRSKS